MGAFVLQVTAKELGGDLAEFFQLFARCASVVPTAEANSCIEQLSNSLLPVVSQEKCEVRSSKFIAWLFFYTESCMFKTFNFLTQFYSHLFFRTVHFSDFFVSFSECLFSGWHL